MLDNYWTDMDDSWQTDWVWTISLWVPPLSIRHWHHSWYRARCVCCQTNCPGIVLATGPGILAAVRVWTAEMGRVTSRPVQNPDQLTLDGPNLDPYPSTHRFRWGWLDLTVPISGPAFRVWHLWSHSNILLMIVKYGHWYNTVHFRCIGCLNDQDKKTQVPYHTPKMTVNGASTIVGRVSWSIWGCARSNTVINTVLPAFIAQKASETFPTPSWKLVSMECQLFWVLHPR